VSTLAQALATARRAKGLSQEQLAAAAGVTQEAVSRYESERRVPYPDVLAKLADALGVTPAFLEGVGKVQGAWAIDAHMRRRASARASVWRRLEARLNMLRHHARYLYEEIDVRTDHVVPTFDPFYTEPEDAARMTRMQWRMPVGPIRSLTEWVEGAGCLVIEEDFGTERVDGLSQWVDDHPVLLLNLVSPVDRKRLTITHELAHLCLHTQDISEDVESEANRFAAEFLMPAEVIRPQLRNLSLGKLLDLKRVWGVSIQALIERAAQLKVLSLERRTAFYKQLSARGWRKQEPGSAELPPETPQLARTIGLALRERGLSPDDIATLTGFSAASSENPFIPPSPHRLYAV
jgi:Zn-dependent peptidase ImmA (M78 family)/transcriptional regulator with XRE-family HTH domain